MKWAFRIFTALGILLSILAANWAAAAWATIALMHHERAVMLGAR